MTLVELEAMPPGSIVKLTANAVVSTRGGDILHFPGPLAAEYVVRCHGRFKDPEAAAQFLTVLERM